MNIRQEIEGCIEAFVLDLLDVKGVIESERRDAVEGNLRLLKIEENLKQQKTYNEKELEEGKKGIKKEIERHQKLNEEVGVFQLRLNDKIRKTEDDLKTIEKDKAETETLKTKAEEKGVELDNKLADVAHRLKAVEVEGEALETTKKQLKEKEKKLDDRDSVIKQKEATLSEKEIELANSYQDLNISKRKVEKEKSEAILDNETIKLELAIQKDNTEMTKQTLDKAVKAEEKYNSLIKLLGKDQKQMEEDKAKIVEDKKKLELQGVK